MREPLGVILAGGRGSRMGTVSKADVMLGGESLLARCAGRLDPQCSDIIVAANAPVHTNLTVVADSITGYLGPLAGVLAGLEYGLTQGHDTIVTVAVDTPFFPCDLVPNLMLAGMAHPDGFAVAATPNNQHGTFGLWPVTLIAPLRQFLNDGHRKVRIFANDNNAATALFPHTSPDSFFNINTPENLQEASQWM